jgi:hypothetical protein
MVLNPARGDAYYPTTPRNLLGSTEDFSAAAWTKTNILAFGSGSISNAIVAPNGLQTADKIVSSTANNNHRVQWSVAGVLVSNTKYVFSFYAKAAEYTKVQIADAVYSVYSARFDLTGSGSVVASSGCTAAITSVGDGWYRCSAIYTSGGANAWAHISPYPDSGATFSVDGASYTGDGISGIYVWGAQLSDSASLDAYSPVYGAAVTSAAYYAPRLDYDANGSALGLLVEEQRTNISPYSEVFSSWNTTGGAGVTINSNVAIAPSGAQTADEAVAQGANASVSNPLTVANTVYTLSLWVRAGTSTAFRFGLYDTVSFVNATGSIISGSGSISGTGLMTVTGLTSSWTRVSLTTTAAVTAGAATIFIYPGPFPQTAGDSVMLWGAQLEVGASNAAAPFATSYIPTIGNTTATRTADVASVSTQAFPYSSTASSIVISLRHPTAASPSGSNQGHWRLDLAGSPVVRQDRFDNSANIAFRGLSLNVDTGKSLGTSVGKVATAFTTGDVALVVNGGSAYTNSSAAGSQVADNFLIGRTGVTSEYLNGWIRQITYIPRRLSNSELQARTV